MKSYFLCLLGLLFAVSCIDSPEVELQEDVKDLFLLFEAEGLSRGKEIDVQGMDLTARFEYLEGEVLGQCERYSDGSKVIVLDQSNWDEASEIEKEFLLFHELGHCVLGREHDNSKDNKGFCTSIMQSGTGSCKKKYNDSNRASMLDELFQE